MGTKRSRSEADAGRAPPPKKHKKIKKPVLETDPSRPESFNGVKKRARTIERKLNHGDGDIPPGVRDDLKHELAALKQRIAQHDGKKNRNHMIKKYHMVRFFERKKAQRLERQLRQRLSETEDPKEIASLQADLHVAEVDINYAIYFPFLERYVSLYTKTEKTDDKTASATLSLRSERPPLWHIVEKAMEAGPGALRRLQNRQPVPDSQAASRSQGSSKKGQPAAESQNNESSNRKPAVSDSAPLEKDHTRSKYEAPNGRNPNRSKKEHVAEGSESDDSGTDSEDVGFLE